MLNEWREKALKYAMFVEEVEEKTVKTTAISRTAVRESSVCRYHATAPPTLETPLHHSIIVLRGFGRILYWFLIMSRDDSPPVISPG